MWLHFHIQLHQIITLQHNTMHIGPLFLGTLQMEPATNWFDESFATILKSHERFARQQRSRPSITYHVTSANSRIDHQLSGIKNIVLMHGQFNREKTHSVLFTFIPKPWIHPGHLTIFSNSLIRVTRRDARPNGRGGGHNRICGRLSWWAVLALGKHKVIPRVSGEAQD